MASMLSHHVTVFESRIYKIPEASGPGAGIGEYTKYLKLLVLGQVLEFDSVLCFKLFTILSIRDIPNTIRDPLSSF